MAQARFVLPAFPSPRWPLAVACLAPSLLASLSLTGCGAGVAVSALPDRSVPAVLWAQPQPISSVTALGPAQLDATASIPGNFAYSPAAGSYLAPGNQTLSVTFTPADGADYATVTQTTTIMVNQPVPQYTWRNVAIVGGGFVTGLVAHPTQPNLRYARTDVGGCYRWNTATGAWAPLLDFETAANFFHSGCESIALDPVNPQKLYLAVGMYDDSYGTNGQMLISNDQGATFTAVDLPFKNGSNDDGRGAGERLAVDPNLGSKLYFGTRQNGLWTSADSGMSWTQVASFPVTGPTAGAGINFVDFIPSSGASGTATPVIYVGVSDTGVSTTGYSALYRSVDSGATWQVVPGQPTGYMASHGVLGPDAALYLAFNNAIGPQGITDGQLWRYLLPPASTPSAAGIWTNITPTGTLRPANSEGGYGTIAVDPQRPGTIMATTIDDYSASGQDDIYRSTNSGATWVSLNQQGATRNSSLSPWLTFGKETAGTGNWASSLVIDPLNSNHVLYATGQTVWESTNINLSDAGLAPGFTVGAAGIEETVVNALVSPPTGPLLLSAVSDLGGFVHTSVTSSPAGGMAMNPILTSGTGVDFAQLIPATMARVGSGTSSFGAYTNNAGASWVPFAAAPGTVLGEGSIAVSADGNTLVWAPADAPVAYSTTHGATWSPSAGATAMSGIVADRVNPLKFYILAAGTLQMSADGGKTFANIATGLPAGATLAASPAAEGDLWLSAGNGLFRSTNSGASFNQIGGGITQAGAFGFGRAAPSAKYPALYLSGTGASGYGFYRSLDAGQSWVLINDSAHEFGDILCLTGDPKTYGRVYLGTGGRGIIVGDSPQ